MSSLHPEGVCHPPELPPLGAECAAVQSPPADAPKPNPGSSYEIQRIQHRIDGFNWKNSHAWLCLCSQFGPRLNQEELVSIAELTASRLGIRLDRDARRRKVVMIKWFQEHWAALQPLLRLVILEA
jgi:hypothetical protein